MIFLTGSKNIQSDNFIELKNRAMDEFRDSVLSVINVTGILFCIFLNKLEVVAYEE